MKIQSNFHIATGDNLKTLSGFRVEKPKYLDDVPSYKLGNYTIGFARYVHCYVSGKLWFFPISDNSDEEALKEALEKKLESFDSIERDTTENQDELWIVDIPRMLVHSLVSAVTKKKTAKMEIKKRKNRPIMIGLKEEDDALSFRFHRIDQFHLGMSIDLVRKSGELGSLRIAARKKRTDEIISIMIPEDGLQIHFAGLCIIIPREPLEIEWDEK